MKILAYISLVLMISLGSIFNCNAKNSKNSKFYELQEFTSLCIQNNLDVELVKSDFYGVEQMNNLSEAIVKLEVKESKLRVFVDTDKMLNKRIKVKVYLPTIFSLNIDDGAEVHSKDTFVFGHVVICLSNASKVKMHIQAKKMEAYISNSSYLSLKGSCDKQLIYSENSSKYQASNFKSNHTEIHASNSTKANIFSEKTIIGDISTRSNVNVKGTPVVAKVEQVSHGQLFIRN
ncbi:DUF2807 domain-containing protein [Halosquirtibacter xylanolyticus]|uniref:GIN domain-containing protein n=1 Tax=Halosquirtibacter xylanolyticus TaxID=3374599 RepID=UPI003749B5ED|nr:DUF2807 domain-containing protein [Prolixibacteraceae bacterium]